MSGPERQPPDDRMLDDFLAGRSPVSRAWRDATRDDAAPPEMDQAVLGLAREELRKPVPVARDRFRDRRWPFALVAVLVLSFSTLLKITQDPATLKDAMMVGPDVGPVVPASAPVAADAELVMPAQPESELVAPAASAGAVSAQRQRLQERDDAASAAAEATQRRVMEREAREAKAMAAPKAEAAGAPAFAPEPPAPMAAPPPPAVEASEALRAAPAPAKRLEEAPGYPDADSDGVPEAREQAPKPLQRAAPKAKTGQAAAPAGLAADQASDSDSRLDRVRQLLAEGREVDARREFQAWRRAFPQASIPVDLSWLEAPR